jgi:hypothetical protein
MLQREDVTGEVRVPVQMSLAGWEDLPVPRTVAGYDVDQETWVLDASGPRLTLDTVGRIGAIASTSDGVSQERSRAGGAVELDFADPSTAGLVHLPDVHAGLVDYKTRRGYGNVFVPRSVIGEILRSATIRVPAADLADPVRVREAASATMRTYLDRWVRRRERTAQSAHLGPVPLRALREVAPPYYTIRGSRELLSEIEELLERKSDLLQDGGPPLPRLNVDRHLFNPILLEHRTLSVRPPGLKPTEQALLREVRDFWRANHDKGEYRGRTVTLLRNEPGTGVGFFQRSGFFPDFILWLQDEGSDRVHVRFLEPHGMHHGGLKGNEDKIESLRMLETISAQPAFVARGVSLSGWLLTQTPLDQIPDAAGLSWQDLEVDHRLLSLERPFAERLLRIKD